MKGLIISFICGDYKIYDLDTKEISVSKPRGILKIKNLIPKVGDICTYHTEQGGLSIIDSIDERKNDLIRPNVCNVDQAIIVFSVKEPELNLNLLDKFLVTLEYYSIKPIIIFSKWDLLKSNEIKDILEIINYYESIGYKCIKTSTIGMIDKNVFDEVLKDKITVFTGQSGVGKSSIINELDSTLNIETQEISEALGRGKHTTRHVEFFPYENGFICDTPGFGTLSFNEFDESTLSMNFIDLFEYSKDCYYHPCLHINEPHCKVKEALNNGKLLKSRYENYCLFLKEVQTKDQKPKREIKLTKRKRA